MNQPTTVCICVVSGLMTAALTLSLSGPFLESSKEHGKDWGLETQPIDFVPTDHRRTQVSFSGSHL